MDRRLLFFLLISLTIHMMVMTYVHRKNIPNPKSDQVTIEIIDINELNKIDKGQIVEQSDEALNDIIPEKTKFLSQHNQKVVEETKAANSGKFTNKVSGANDANANKKEAPNEWGTKPKKSLLEKLTPGYKWPKVDSISQASTDDYLKDVKDGVQTLLSTREFIYYTYYKRIKNQLAQYWEPKIKDKVVRLIHQGRNIASSGDKITRLIITLDSKGILTKVQVVGASGLKDLDDAAVEAFRAAAPFPNPPKGIVEQDGNIHITWDFVLEV